MTSTFTCEKPIFHLATINWSQGDHFGMLCLIEIWKKVVFCFKKCSDILCFKLTFVRLCMWGCMQDLRKNCWLFATHFITIFQSAIFTLYFFLLQMSMRHNILRRSPWLQLIMAKWKFGFLQLKVHVIQWHYPCPWQLILPIWPLRNWTF